MSDFERRYYEVDAFWEKGAITDVGNRKRVEYTASIVPKECESVVDVGCGNGIFLRFLRQMRPDLRLLGMDRSTAALRHVDCEKIEGDITRIPLEDNSFDCVVCSQVLEHIAVPSYDIAISELARVSSKYLIISVPFQENLEAAFTRCPSCKSCFNRDLHLRTYSADTMSDLFTKAGFSHIHSMNLIKSRHYIGIEWYNWLRTIGQHKVFESPICPICGYENGSYVQNPSDCGGVSPTPSRSLLKRCVKRIWPMKTVNGYWIVSLYSKQ